MKVSELFEAEQSEYPTAAQINAGLKRVFPDLESKKFKMRDAGGTTAWYNFNDWFEKKIVALKNVDLIPGWPPLSARFSEATWGQIPFSGSGYKCVVQFDYDFRSQMLFAISAKVTPHGQNTKTYILHKGAFLHSKTDAHLENLGGTSDWKHPAHHDFNLEHLKEWFKLQVEGFEKGDDYELHPKHIIETALDHLRIVKKVLKGHDAEIEKLTKDFVIKILLHSVKHAVNLEDGARQMANETKGTITYLREKGYDFDEFAVIERTINKMLEPKSKKKSTAPKPKEDDEWVTESA